jgi:hypothetical protein
MPLILDDPTDDPTPSEVADAPVRKNLCHICGDPSDDPECDSCAEAEYRRWASE